MSFALITLDISDYIPQNFHFDNFSFIFSSDGHDFEDGINYMSRNQITHKSFLNKKDIRYSIKVLRNDSLIGISDFIIPSILLSRKEEFYEKICVINMTDSTKRILFGNLSPTNTLRINIKANIHYMQEKTMIKQNTGGLRKDKNKLFSPKISNINSKKKNPNISPGVGGLVDARAANNNNPAGNFVFNKQQIPMSISSRKADLKNNVNIGSRVQNKYGNITNNNKQNMADAMIQQQLQMNNNKFINNVNINMNKNRENIAKVENKEVEPQEDDPTDTSVLNEEIAHPIQLIDKEFTEFMSKFIEKNPLEQLSQFKDINEMLIYTKNVIDKLLSYQQEYYDRLKSSITLNNRLNELLMKYNEKYRNIVKKVHRLNEETNSNDMRKDAVVNIHRTENSNLKQIIPLKVKELKLYKEMCGEGLESITKEIMQSEKDKNTEEKNEESKKNKLLMKLLQNCINNYGPLDTLFNKDGISNDDKKFIAAINEKLNSECKKTDENLNNNRNELPEGKLEYVISDNPDELDIKLNQNLISIYSENRVPTILFKKVEGNVYEYGSQRITILEEENVIKVQNDEGTLLLDNYIEINGHAEEEKIKETNIK